MTVAHKRKEAAFLKSVSQIVSEEITNVNISYTTVTDVKLTRDGSHLNVYVTFLHNKDKSMENLLKTSGFVRKRLSAASRLRMVPEIHFKHDGATEEGNRIDQLLKEISTKK